MKITPVVLLLLISINSSWSQTSDEFFRLSIEQLNNSKYPEALILINKAIMLDSIRADYFLQRATIYLKQTKYDEAIKDCYSALRIQPDKPEIYNLRGQICLVTESYGGAILFFGKTIKAARNNDLLFNAYINRGKAYDALGKFDDAHNDFISASALNPESGTVLILLAENYFKLKQSNEALAILNKVVNDQPNNPQIYELIGRISMENKDYARSIEALNKYCSLVTNSSSALNLLAQAYLLTNDLVNAFLTVNRAITLNPNDPVNYKTKGAIFFEKGQAEEGCNCYFKAMQLGYLEKVSYDLLDIYILKCEHE